MFDFKRILCAVSLALAASAAVTTVVPPASRGLPASSDNTLDPNASTTDTETIVQTVNIVDQKGGATGDAPPNQPVPETVVTAVDGELTAAGTSGSSSSRRRSLGDLVLSSRTSPGYEKVFDGTGTGPDDRDASIQGTAYLTYTVVPNSTYSVDACLDFCTRVDGCVFANLYYEFNNDLLDFVFSEKSNLKCAIYGDIHSAAEKTNFGGQQLLPLPHGLTYMQQSTGWAATSLADPAVPDGYELVFGPTNGANNAPGYMGFAFLDKYDVNACAQLCNTRGADSVGGACQYFNIWRAVVNGNPTTYTCSMYYLPSDASTAVNYGQGDLHVTYSRGYRRKNLAIDGGFEGYTCSGGGDFCFDTSYSNWVGTSPQGGRLDATVFHFSPYAHAGSSSVILGSADGSDALAGTITPAHPLNTVAGKKYQISFFQQSTYSGPTLEADAFFEVHWNGAVVATEHPGATAWKFYSYEVTAQGNDVFAIRGGKAPAWSFIDDVSVYPL